VRLRGLYAVTPEVSDAVEKVRLALEGGVALLQYRRKRRDLAEARAVAALARRHGVPLIVNDDVLTEGIANASTRYAFEQLAAKIADDAVWEAPQ